MVPEKEVERIVDQVTDRLKAESNALLSEQAAAAHLLKYKAKYRRDVIDVKSKWRKLETEHKDLQRSMSLFA